MTKKICVFADISPEIANGHFFRCLAVAGGLQDKARVTFITPDNDWAAGYVTTYQHGHPDSPIAFRKLDFTLPPELKNDRFAPMPAGAIASLPTDQDIYVVDNYRATAAQLRKLHDRASVVAFDDFDNRSLSPGDVDAVINAGMPEGTIDYRGLPILSPPNYHILPEKFFTGTRVPDSSRVILSFGGADKGQVGLRLLERLIDKAPALARHYRFDLVLPCKEEDRLADAAPLQAALGDRLTITRRYEAGSSFYLDAAMLICGGGQTLQEAQACSLPIAGVGFINDSQTLTAAHFRKHGIVTHDLREVAAGGQTDRLDIFAEALIPVMHDRRATLLTPYKPDGFARLVAAINDLPVRHPA